MSHDLGPAATRAAATPARARYATLHWLRYPAIRVATDLPLDATPPNCLAWKIGADGPVGPDGGRLPSDVWCALGLYRDEASARAAFAARASHLPLLDTTVESWHVLLVALTHRGEANHLERDRPGLIFEAGQSDPGGPLVVLTTAGFTLGPGFDPARAIAFRRAVDRVRGWLQAAPGLVASQVFTPHVLGDDGATMSVWTSEAAMAAAAYRPGMHREEIDHYKRDHTADRTSFTRLRALATAGTWNGVDPIEVARRQDAATP